MQNRVLDAADILIDRHPVVGDLRVGRRLLVPRIGEAHEVPGRVDEGVHGVGLAPRRACALRARDVLPGRMAVERIARSVEGDVFRQRDRQIFFRHRHDAAFLAVDDRDRAAPIALARNAPVAQAVIDLALADRTVAARFLLQALGHFFFRLLDGHAVEEARVDHLAVANIGTSVMTKVAGILARRADHRRIAEAVFVGEFEIALVVRRAAEDARRCRNPSARNWRHRPAASSRRRTDAAP